MVLLPLFLFAFVHSLQWQWGRDGYRHPARVSAPVSASGSSAPNRPRTESMSRGWETSTNDSTKCRFFWADSCTHAFPRRPNPRVLAMDTCSKVYGKRDDAPPIILPIVRSRPSACKTIRCPYPGHKGCGKFYQPTHILFQWGVAGTGNCGHRPCRAHRCSMPTCCGTAKSRRPLRAFQ